jgi:hypothetical protein
MSLIGTFETCQRTLKKSAYDGKPEENHSIDGVFTQPGPKADTSLWPATSGFQRAKIAIECPLSGSKQRLKRPKFYNLGT